MTISTAGTKVDASRSSDPVLAVQGLKVVGDDDSFTVVEGVSFSLERGETLGIVGESGSGKTTVAMALLGFTRPGTKISEGRVALNGEDLLSLSPRDLIARRGTHVSYVPQDPSTGLPPNIRVGDLLRQMLTVHGSAGGDETREVRSVLEATQLPADDGFQRRYPFELSGGQQQRVAIALSLICRPSLIVMDEPTTGLDVTTQSRLLRVVADLVKQSRISLVYVSHDLGVVRSLSDKVAVMYGGRVVESARVGEVFVDPRHPYSRGLLEAVPRASTLAYRPRAIPGDAVEPWNWPPGCPFAPRCPEHRGDCDVTMPLPQSIGEDRVIRCVLEGGISGRPVGLEEFARMPHSDASRDVVLRVEELVAGYARTSWLGRGRQIEVVKGASFEVAKGECLALVGESGSGKTTTLRCIAGLREPLSGRVTFDGGPLAGLVRRRPLGQRRSIQLVPQNPDSSLNPRHTVGEIVARPLKLFERLSGSDRKSRVDEILEQVHLRPVMAHRSPRELSGGEKQRVAIARALAASPELLLCDEVVSALDVAVQAGILALLDELRRTLNMTIVLVTHDLGVVRSVASRVVVMNGGVICEEGPTQQLFDNPKDPFTRDLLEAIPHLGARDYPGVPTR